MRWKQGGWVGNAPAAHVRAPDTPGTRRHHDGIQHIRHLTTLKAEGVGFEPTNRGYLLAVFKTAAIGH